MRTIKFRGKRVDNGEWVYGDLYTFQKVRIRGNDGHYWEFEVIPETVGQFTGKIIYDEYCNDDGEVIRTQQEVYEHDIVCYLKEKGGVGYGVVEYDDCCEFRIYDEKEHYIESLGSVFLIALAGNINDNPELLVGSK